MDLKAAFDTVNGKRLTDTIRGRRIKERGTERVADLLRKTRSRMRMGGETRGVS